VQPGEDLWSIAQHLQGQALRRPATDAETAAYWAQLLDANSNTLALPDLLYAGQALNLPDRTANDGPQPLQTNGP
jgi:hypothetical protein